MSHLPSFKAREIIKRLVELGFVSVRQKGSHVFYKHPDGRTTVVPVHAGESVGRRLFSKILSDIKLTPEEFLNSD